MRNKTPKHITLEQESVWLNSPYALFLQHCNRDELLRSQTPFYYAVEAFPLLLLKLASMIPDSDARYFIVENIWEEHGQGDSDKFHTKSFIRHLNSLGFDGELYKNPFITTWIDALLATDCPKTLFHNLAAIEYIYAVISDSISDKLNGMTLLSEPDHYQKHSEIDWTHGEEILISMSKCGIEFDATLFIQAQHDFITLFGQMSLPTMSEVDLLMKREPVSFVYARESTNVIDQVLASINADDLAVLCICSGGENPIHYAKNTKVSHVSAFDLSLGQLQVCRDKINRDFDHSTPGSFEFLFERVRRYFTGEDGKNNILIAYEANPDLLAWVIGNTFTDSILSSIFTDEAVKYTKASFSDHFTRVYFGMCEDAKRANPHPNTLNVLLNVPVDAEVGNGVLVADKVSLFHLNASQALSRGSYDVIDLSNIGDWMPIVEFKALLTSARQALKPNGSIVLRKLLGDYCLSSIGFIDVTPLHDNTGFYTQTVVVK
jgi:hypothetical protein